MNHSLVILSGNDAHADCSCGQQIVRKRSVDSESEDSIYQKIRLRYLVHLHEVVETRFGDTLSVPPARRES